MKSLKNVKEFGVIEKDKFVLKEEFDRFKKEANNKFVSKFFKTFS